MAKERKDTRTSTLINHSVENLKDLGARSVAEYLCINGIPFHVAHRVILFPSLRRN